MPPAHGSVTHGAPARTSDARSTVGELLGRERVPETASPRRRLGRVVLGEVVEDQVAVGALDVRHAVPLRQLDTELGARQVEDLLLRIAHGVYS